MNLKIPNNKELASDEELICLYLLSKTNIYDTVSSLVKKGFVKYDEKLSTYVLKPKAKFIINQCTLENTNLDIAIEELTEKYINVFKDNEGNPLKPGVTSTKKEVKKRLTEFLSMYSYTPDEILEAIQNYVNSNIQTGYKYLQKAHYTIKKYNVHEKTWESNLLTFCQELESKENKKEDNNFYDVL